jgi:hypothetical protein
LVTECPVLYLALILLHPGLVCVLLRNGGKSTNLFAGFADFLGTRFSGKTAGIDVAACCGRLFQFLDHTPYREACWTSDPKCRSFILPILPLAMRFSSPIVEWSSGWANAFGRINNSPFWILSGVVYYVGLPLVIIPVFAAFYLLVNKNRAALLLSLAVVIPLLIIMAFSLFQCLANRYVFVSLPAFIILASVAVKELLVDK